MKGVYPILTGVLMALGSLTLGAAPGLAFCPVPNPPRVCTEFFRANAVFVGTVVYVTQKPGGDDFIEGWTYELKVKKKYKGIDKSIVEVFSSNDSARLPLRLGHTYLLFPETNDDGILQIYGCGNSDELPKANAAIRQIRHLIKHKSKKGSAGDIGGQVNTTYDYETGTPVEYFAGIIVTARAGKDSYRSMTDKYGSFHIRVPAGRYTVETSSSEWEVTPVDISYERPDNVEIEDGGCADLAFQARRR